MVSLMSAIFEVGDLKAEGLGLRLYLRIEQLRVILCVIAHLVLEIIIYILIGSTSDGVMMLKKAHLSYKSLSLTLLSSQVACDIGQIEEIESVKSACHLSIR
jgi:hypothetical protein